MATTQKTPRLLAAAKEFNIGKETLIEFLTEKGFEVNASNPNTKLTAEMYASLQGEFAQDKAAKRKSEEIALPKGSLLDNINKSKEELDITAREKEEEEQKAAEKAEAVEAKEEKKTKAKKEEPKEEPKEEKPKEEPVVEKKEEEPKEEPKKAKAVEKKEEELKEEPKAEKEEEKPKEEEKKTGGKLNGPNVLGKIDLDSIDKGKKKAAKKKAEKKEEDAASKKVAQKKVAKKEEVTEKPAAKEVTAKKEDKPTGKVVIPKKKDETLSEEEKEHIQMKAPKLEGPKIIGKIELKTKKESDNKKDSKEKRSRKRIPLQKKGGDNNNNRGGGPNRGGGNNKGGGGRDRRNDRRGGGDRRGGRGQQQQPQQEIDEKAIQDKIRQTQAKLAGGGGRNKGKAKYRRNKREEMAEKRAAAEQASEDKVIQVTEFISVSELASLLDVSFADVISKCMSLGIMVSINQRLDAEVIELVAGEFDTEVEFIDLEQEAEKEEEEQEDDPKDLEPRAPIVTIMGHVDHGKTSLLDYIREANVVSGEAGGITQHIGAYRVTTESGKQITFLDTPGHEAFTAMRARGAKVADVAVIVIAADDAIMPQTKEAISHAQAANLPMIFAINKIDKEGANPEKIKEQLSAMNILVEDWGGKYQSQEISAKNGLNIDELLEKITLEAELLELQANPNRDAVGSVIEASLDKGRGYQTTILVQTGTLKIGDMVVCGQYYGKMKAMFNERGQRVESAGPSTPVQVLGLNGAPQSGEKSKVYIDEDEAKNIATHRAQILREQGIRTRKHITLDEIGRRLALGNFKELSLIIKADFDGSVEALTDALQKLSTEEVAVNIVHKGVGAISESDVLLATASDAIILGFQVRASMQAARLAEQENIEIRYYSIIYDAIGEIKSAMEGLLEPKIERKTACNIEVREVFKISGVGTIAGCYVMDGKVARNMKVNLIRDGIVTYTGELASLKRFKDDVKEVSAGYECGLSIKNYNDLKVGDVIEGFEEVEVKRTLSGN